MIETFEKSKIDMLQNDQQNILQIRVITTKYKKKRKNCYKTRLNQDFIEKGKYFFEK